jgi:hypothetical protein
MGQTSHFYCKEINFKHLTKEAFPYVKAFLGAISLIMMKGTSR